MYMSNVVKKYELLTQGSALKKSEPLTQRHVKAIINTKLYLQFKIIDQNHVCCIILSHVHQQLEDITTIWPSTESHLYFQSFPYHQLYSYDIMTYKNSESE